MADDSPPDRSAADKERSRQQSRPVNAKKPTSSSTGATAGKGGSKPPAKSPAKSTAKPSSSSGSRPPGQKPKTATGGSGRGGSSGRRPIQPAKGRGPRRSPTSIFTWGVVGLVLVIVAVLVVIKVTGSSTPGNTTPTAFVQTSAQIIDQATSIPTSVYDKVGIESSLAEINQPIILKNQATLVLAGKPGIFAFLGEFCPYCAAERWAIVTSLSRFGKFTNIGDMQSSSTDVFANTQTFTFTKATFQSPYVTFQPVERYSNVIDPSTGNWKIIAPFTALQAKLVSKYDSSQYVGSSAGGIPFMDVGNKALFAGPSYTPAILANLSRSEIAANLDDPTNGVTQAILASSNYISATVCEIDGQMPTDVCSSKGVTEAATALKLNS
jgi:hypothetical protein